MLRRILFSVASGIALALVNSIDTPTSAQQAASASDRNAPGPVQLHAGNIENLYRLSPQLLSGGQPEGIGGFTALKDLGVKTVISVDGAAPDVASAERAGLRYVHLPVGYDGITRDQALQIIKAAKALPKPIYIHCHHGKHRGPTAAALCGLATEKWSTDQALQWLTKAGTAPEYRGLFQTVRTFKPPSNEELARVAESFPTQARVSSLVEVMVEIDGLWDRLKLSREAAFGAPPKHPDIDPPHEALQLSEHFRELLRRQNFPTRSDDFRNKLRGAEKAATQLHEALKSRDEDPSARRKNAESAFQQTAKACTACHELYRDNVPAP